MDYEDYGVRPAIVMGCAAGLTLKDHGRQRTLKGLSRDQHGRWPTDDRRGCGAQADLLRSMPCHDLFW